MIYIGEKMTQKMSITISDYAHERLMELKPEKMTNSEWIEQIMLRQLDTIQSQINRLRDHSVYKEQIEKNKKQRAYASTSEDAKAGLVIKPHPVENKEGMDPAGFEPACLAFRAIKANTISPGDAW